MSNRTNPEYLKNYQYLDAQNLTARIDLHRRFSTNHQDWFCWVFDQFNLQPPVSILELGCGSGLLWKTNMGRIPAGYQIFLSDFSPGMVTQARPNSDTAHQLFHYSVLDAQAIPFQAACFDLVVANHMLYHIPDRPLAIKDIHRVLKPGGKLLAATNGLNHMGEIHQLLLRLDPSLAYHTEHAFGVNEFTIENGASQLAPWFDNIQITPFEGSLEVTEAAPLIAYILSMNTAPHIKVTSQQISNLRDEINRDINLRGSYHITKSTALFVAENL